MNRFLIAVGGTGQHVALALADYHVLGHSVVPEPLAPVSMILLDADPTGSAEKSAWSLADDQVRVLGGLPDGGRSVPLPTWRPATPHRIGDSTLLARNAIDEVEADGTSALMFTQSQLGVQIRSGYHGEPRVAATLADILLQELRGDDQLMARDPLGPALTALAGENRICVAGSAIGGTGAGVLPRLVATMAGWPNRQAQVCAVIGLPWFQIEGGDAAQEMMRANACSCLYHYFRTQRQAEAGYRLVLWGHPSVSQAHRESDYGAKMQGVKSDLTLPIYAAAAAQAFLSAPNDHPESVRETVVPVGRAADDVRLAKSLDFGGGMHLNELLRRNAELIQVLRHAAKYLRQPYRPAAFVGLGGPAWVQGLDDLPGTERTVWAGRIDTLIAAKERAIARLRKSDDQLTFPSAPAWGGIPTLNKHYPAGKPFALAVVGGQPLKARPTEDSSKKFLVPAELTAIGGLNESPPGTRVKIEPGHRMALSPFVGVRATRVPDLFGVDLVLEDALAGDSYWDSPANNKLERRLIGTSGIVAPPHLGAVDGDNYVAWVSRWLILSCALLKGIVRIEPLARGIRGRIEHRLLLDAATPGGDSDLAIGYLSPDLLCVPSLVSFWESPRAVERLIGRIGAWRETVASWTRALRQVATGRRGGTVPGWLKRLELLAGDSERPLARMLRLDPARRVPLRWHGENTDPMLVRVALPTTGEGVGLVELARDMGLPLLSLSTVPDGELSDSERQARDAFRVATAVLHRATNATDWRRAEDMHVVWLDELPTPIQRLVNGGLLLTPGSGRALELPNQAAPISVDEVFCEHLLLFPQRDGTLLRSIPVRAPYISLVRNVRMEMERDDGRQRVAVQLAGRAGEVTQTYGPGQVVRVEDQALNLFSWPSRYTAGGGAHALLLMSARDRRFHARVAFGARGTGPTDLRGFQFASPWLAVSDAFHHLQPTTAASLQAHARMTQDGHPLGIQLLAENLEVLTHLQTSTTTTTSAAQAPPRRDDIDLGFVPYRGTYVPVAAMQAAGEGQVVAAGEHWCIDLGTSSTVVARRPLVQGASPEPMIIWARGASDATEVYSHGEEVPIHYLAWFATWNGFGPRDAETRIMPSQVIERIPRERIRMNNLRYGQDFVLDNGSRIDRDYLSRVVDNLKWRTDSLAAYRKPFIRHMMEQAVAMEFQRAARNGDGAGVPISGTVDVTFTLPLRQRYDLTRFGTEVRAVCEELAKSTAITFRPLFQWESLALIPDAPPGREDVVFLAADLGGGTLDLYAAHYKNGTREADAVESAHIGGEYCVKILHRKQVLDAEHRDLQHYRRLLRNQRSRAENQVLEQSAPEVQEYFALVHRYIVLWTEALRQAWGLAEHVTVRLQLAGLGWSLPGSAGNQAQVAEELSHVHDLLHPPPKAAPGSNSAPASPSPAARLSPASATAGHRFMAWGDDPIAMGVEGRKTYLALTCAKRAPGISEALLEQKANTIQTVLGLTAHQGATDYLPTDPLSAVRGATSVSPADARRLDPKLSDEALSDVNSRLKRAVAPHDLRAGALDNSRLVVSPLTCVAEEAVYQLLRRLAPTGA